MGPPLGVFTKLIVSAGMDKTLAEGFQGLIVRTRCYGAMWGQIAMLSRRFKASSGITMVLGVWKILLLVPGIAKTHSGVG